MPGNDAVNTRRFCERIHAEVAMMKQGVTALTLNDNSKREMSAGACGNRVVGSTYNSFNLMAIFPPSSR